MATNCFRGLVTNLGMMRLMMLYCMKTNKVIGIFECINCTGLKQSPMIHFREDEGSLELTFIRTDLTS